ncbi:nadp-binding domain [Trichoderma arundinaceum]|uniref:Nadp-binding domain n=1 Tax=Trichoderma arundinaceum TaxID=490622 RepID=A0A395NZ92_TRIAR|nr:nadp-binding domain [Trichoderma arundinaceum]
MFAIIRTSRIVSYVTSLALHKVGCEIAVADLQDSKALAKEIGDADTVQIVLPPSPRAKDTAAEMRKAIESLASALEEAHPRRVLAISDYGAHITHGIGMLTMCQHMQGWGRVIPAAIDSGTLLSFHDPVDMLFPTISAPDLGLIAANLLLQPTTEKDIEIVHAEGPRQYSPSDVAVALSELLGRTITAEAVPRSQWKDAFEHVMSVSLAELLIKANDAQNKGGLVDVKPNSAEIHYGTTEFIDALRPLVPTY